MPRSTKKKSDAEKLPDDLFALLKVQTWSDVKVNGITLAPPGPDGPHGFLPVFKTRAQAETWKGVMNYPTAEIIELKRIK